MSVRGKLSGTELTAALRGVALLTLDVDGVLTDGGLYYAEDGSELRRFNVKDGMGIKRLRAVGVEVAILTASTTPAIHRRAERLGLAHCYLGATDKLAVLEALAGDLGIGLARIAHMGDDLNDLPILTRVGCPLTVADAVPEVVDAACFVTRRGGGQGAVREVCDLTVAARRSAMVAPMKGDPLSWPMPLAAASYLPRRPDTVSVIWRASSASAFEPVKAVSMARAIGSSSLRSFGAGFCQLA